MISVTFLNPQPPGVADTVTMSYDGWGRRIGITESHGAIVLTNKTLVWCWGQLCQQRDATGHTVAKQFFVMGEIIGTTQYFYTRDHLENIREMTDGGGTIHANYDYDTYGRKTKLSGDLDSDFGYTGFYQENATGLDLTLFRAYDANKGRWLNRDPLNERAGQNLYSMVLNNPFRFIDLSGLLCSPPTPVQNPTPTSTPSSNGGGGCSICGVGNGNGKNNANNGVVKTPNVWPYNTQYLPFPNIYGPGNLEIVPAVISPLLNNDVVDWLDDVDTAKSYSGHQFPGELMDNWDSFFNWKAFWEAICNGSVPP